MDLTSKISLHKVEKYSHITIQALTEELQILAKYLNVLAINNLLAQITFKKEGKYLKLIGEVQANIVQACAVSATEMVYDISINFTRKFVNESKVNNDKSKSKKNSKIITPKDINLFLDDEEIDVVINNELSFYDIIAEELLLEIDPYKKQIEINDFVR